MKQTTFEEYNWMLPSVYLVSEIIKKWKITEEWDFQFIEKTIDKFTKKIK